MPKVFMRVDRGLLDYTGEILAEVHLKNEVPHEDLDFVRFDLEQAFSNIFDQKMIARYDNEESAVEPGLVLLMPKNR